MREFIAVFRSGEVSRPRIAEILDRCFWRGGAQAWRGKATSSRLDRLAHELRALAPCSAVVVIYEVRAGARSRTPIVRIDLRSCPEKGLAPAALGPDILEPAVLQPAVLSPAEDGGMARDVFGRGSPRSRSDLTGMAAVSIAALFHDLGKATVLFQDKLRRGMKGGKSEADAVRHDLFSAAVWDVLFGDVEDAALAPALAALTSREVDAACRKVVRRLCEIHQDPAAALPFSFTGRAGSLSHLVGMLILTHHRLTSGSNDHVTMTGSRHVRPQSDLKAKAHLAIAPGAPFWREAWWLSRLRREAGNLSPGAMPASVDIALRASLMFADHLGSAFKQRSRTAPSHMANTAPGKAGRKSDPADSLAMHVRRVYGHARAAHDLTHRLRDRFPALDATNLPADVLDPAVSPNPRFAWQRAAAQAAGAMCAAHKGGFFACVMAGTGTGKTRGAPTILANAAMHDALPERRYFRVSLGLGLRVLAAQSAREYIEDLGFEEDDVAVLIGQEPLRFGLDDPESSEGSESAITIPEWLRVVGAGERTPENEAPGDEASEGMDPEGRALEGSSAAAVDKSASVSLNRGRTGDVCGLPPFLEMILAEAGKNAASGRLLLSAPVMVGTIDHLMGVASPVNSRFLLQSLRLLTSDLILDEIDQYDGEDIAAIGRLVFQTGAAGRRVVIMSATLTSDIAEALEAAYRRGWADHARASGTDPHVNLLLCGDASGAVFTNEAGRPIGSLLHDCQQALLAGLRLAPPLRRGEILPPCDTWEQMVAQVDDGCSRLHDLNAVEFDGFRVSIGMVRMTRIAHTAALAAQVRSGDIGGRLRLVVCLHSQMPRLHRAYIEMRLKRALTRKGTDPERGVRRLCAAENVFEKALAIGARDIEIVVFTSPVIETGNDLDFDYGVLDPISVRAIIHAAGRIRRHRPAQGGHLNILILGRSPIAMQGGLLAMPGVETRPAMETLVPRRDLSAFEGRLFADLAGDETFARVSAAPILSDAGSFPLRDAEADLRRLMVSAAPPSPLGVYIARPNARWNLTMTRTRKFRRSEAGELLFCRVGDCLEKSSWYIDLAPGTKSSALRSASVCSASLPVHSLFGNLTASAWSEMSSGDRGMESADLRNLMQVSIAWYEHDFIPAFSYSEITGFTRGAPEDLLMAFGKPSAASGIR